VPGPAAPVFRGQAEREAEQREAWGSQEETINQTAELAKRRKSIRPAGASASRARKATDWAGGGPPNGACPPGGYSTRRAPVYRGDQHRARGGKGRGGLARDRDEHAPGGGYRST